MCTAVRTHCDSTQFATTESNMIEPPGVYPKEKAHIVPSLPKIEAMRMASEGSMLSEPGDGSIR